MDELAYTYKSPVKELSELVESFWMIANKGTAAKDIIVLPDGRIDLSFPFSDPSRATLIGIETSPSKVVFEPGTSMFVISFKLPAIEYIFHQKQAVGINKIRSVSSDLFGTTLKNFESFDKQVDLLTQKLLSICPSIPDERKRILFDHIYSSSGQTPVNELAALCFWSSRQINRYFNDWFGISLKAYCDILRFRQSFTEIGKGNIYPAQNFTDQAHLIKTVKRFAGVTPGTLNRNEDEQFIQITALKQDLPDRRKQ